MLLPLRGRIARFSYRNGDTIALFVDIHILTNTGYKFYKDHAWIVVDKVSKLQNKKNKQGKDMYFLAKEHTYKDYDLSDKVGLKIKFPDKVVIMPPITKNTKGKQMKVKLRYKTDKGALRHFIVPIKPLLEELDKEENKSEHWIESMRPRLASKYRCSELVIEEQIAPHLFNQYTIG